MGAMPVTQLNTHGLLGHVPQPDIGYHCDIIIYAFQGGARLGEDRQGAGLPPLQMPWEPQSSLRLWAPGKAVPRWKPRRLGQGRGRGARH